MEKIPNRCPPPQKVQEFTTQSAREAGMEPEDSLARRTDDPLRLLVKEDLDRLSVAELDERVRLLEGEIARVKAKRDGASSFRSVADSLFRSPNA